MGFSNNYYPAYSMRIEVMEDAVDDGGTGLVGSELHGFFNQSSVVKDIFIAVEVFNEKMDPKSFHV